MDNRHLASQYAPFLRSFVLFRRSLPFFSREKSGVLRDVGLLCVEVRIAARVWHDFGESGTSESRERVRGFV